MAIPTTINSQWVGKKLLYGGNPVVSIDIPRRPRGGGLGILGPLTSVFNGIDQLKHAKNPEDVLKLANEAMEGLKEQAAGGIGGLALEFLL